MKNLRLHSVSIHSNFYLYLFITSMLERKKNKSWSPFTFLKIRQSIDILTMT